MGAPSDHPFLMGFLGIPAPLEGPTAQLLQSTVTTDLDKAQISALSHNSLLLFKTESHIRIYVTHQPTRFSNISKNNSKAELTQMNKYSSELLQKPVLSWDSPKILFFYFDLLHVPP
jgi:hypothetical protein